jgi:cell division protein FtsI (penicillin-binding protein 3)
MEAVVTEGTGRIAFKDIPFAIAGKTGTAHVADGNIKYGAGVYQASFVGYFPADDPEYSCIVVIRTRPHAAIHYGGTLAGPVFKEVATKLYAMYVNQKSPHLYTARKDSSAYYYAGNTRDIKKVFGTLNMDYTDSAVKGNWSNVFAANYQPVIKTTMISRKIMPDLKGMGLKDALYLLESIGMKVSVKGKGKVVSQSIEAGRELAEEMKVVLELS